MLWLILITVVHDWRQNVAQSLSFKCYTIATLLNLESNLKNPFAQKLRSPAFCSQKTRCKKEGVKLEFGSSSHSYLELSFAEVVKQQFSKTI